MNNTTYKKLCCNKPMALEEVKPNYLFFRCDSCNNEMEIIKPPKGFTFPVISHSRDVLK